MSVWKDTTSYSRGERGVAEPRSWSCDNVIIHRTLYEADKWHVTAHCLRIEAFPLDATDVKEAQIEALKFVVEHLRKMLSKTEANLKKTETSR